jgi:hypothetical protein
MRKIIFIFTFIMLCAVTVSLAETLYLKDGSAVKGKITTRDPYFVIIQQGNIPSKYSRKDIDWIDEGDEEDVAMNSIEDISEEKKDLILEFMENSGMVSRLENNMKLIIENAPQERRGELETLLDVDEIIDTLIPIYDKYYSEDELNEFIKFYQSPTGQKLLEVTPMILEEVMRASIKYIQNKMSP